MHEYIEFHNLSMEFRSSVLWKNVEIDEPKVLNGLQFGPPRWWIEIRRLVQLLGFARGKSEGSLCSNFFSAIRQGRDVSIKSGRLGPAASGQS